MELLVLNDSLIGNANKVAETIREKLQTKSADLEAAPEKFYAQGTEGPNVAGELERAAVWAGKIATAFND